VVVALAGGDETRHQLSRVGTEFPFERCDDSRSFWSALHSRGQLAPVFVLPLCRPRRHHAPAGRFCTPLATQTSLSPEFRATNDRHVG
jgi:hypothetical protein